MAISQTEVESQVGGLNKIGLDTLIELAKKSFGTFCDDISGMFDVDMACNQQEVATETAKGLEKHFKEPAVVNLVKAEGSLNGTFQLVFDQEGLFTLAGVIAMHPEGTILENRKLGSVEKAKDLSEVLTEMGETLVGAWERTFRKGLDDHSRLVQTNTFIGNPWDNSDERIGLAGDEELVFVPYEMTIAPYPAFKCGVILPKTIFADTPASAPEQTASSEEKNQDEETAAEEADSKESDIAQENGSEKTKPQEPIVEEAATERTPTEKDTEEENVAEKEAAAEQADIATEEVGDANKESLETEPQATVTETTNGVDTHAPDSVAEEKQTPATEADSSEDRPEAESIQEMSESPAALSGEPSVSAPAGNSALSSTGEKILAKDIMQRDVIWGDPDDSVQQALAKMEQYDADCMMIGNDGALQGIVSKSDLTGALSPYLRPAFAKWRRPLDDATLQIKIKWIMTTNVHTIDLETPSADIMENMCRSGRRFLPVIDQQNNVQGLITAFDIFKALLRSGPNIPTEAKAPQAPTSA